MLVLTDAEPEIRPPDRSSSSRWILSTSNYRWKVNDSKCSKIFVMPPWFLWLSKVGPGKPLCWLQTCEHTEIRTKDKTQAYMKPDLLKSSHQTQNPSCSLTLAGFSVVQDTTVYLEIVFFRLYLIVHLQNIFSKICCTTLMAVSVYILYNSMHFLVWFPILICVAYTSGPRSSILDGSQETDWCDCPRRGLQRPSRMLGRGRSNSDRCLVQ